MNEFALSAADRQSGLWRRLKQHLEQKRASLRARNDSMALDEHQTSALRGRIAEITDLLALDEPAPGVDP